MNESLLPALSASEMVHCPRGQPVVMVLHDLFFVVLIDLKTTLFDPKMTYF